MVGLSRDPGRLRGGTTRSLSPRAGALQPPFVDFVPHKTDRIRAGGRLFIMLAGVQGTVCGRPRRLGVLDHVMDRQAEQAVELGLSVHNPGLIANPASLAYGQSRLSSCGVVLGQRDHIADGPDVVSAATAVRPCKHTPEQCNGVPADLCAIAVASAPL